MTLYITEKPSQIKPLQLALKANNISNTEIVALAGHILQLYDFKQYDKSLDDYWNNLIANKKIPFYPEELKKEVKPKSSFMSNGRKITSDYKQKFKDIKSKIDKADKIILATDPDNEGATLGLEVIEKANALNKVIGMINMSKLDSSSLQKEVKRIDTLPYLNMYAAGDARAYYDQMFGYNLTMFTTVYLGDGKLLNIGGVKLPTIRMVVERDLEFEKHKEIPFYKITATAKKDNQEFKINIYSDESDENKRYSSLDQAQEIKNKLENSHPIMGYIKNISEKNKTAAPPKPYSLTDLQSVANKKYKLSADQTLKIAQKLYADYKVQSYPRTDCNYYSEGEYETVTQILNNLKTIDTFSKFIQKIKNINNPLKRNIFNDKKIEAHTALSPTLDAEQKSYLKLNDLEQKLFDLTVFRYIIQFLEDYKFLEIKGGGYFRSDDNIKFDFIENVTQDLGYKIVENIKPTLRTTPKLSINDEIEIVNIAIEKGTTKPKPRFTEATLLKAMEKVDRFFDDEEIKKQLADKGIGTPATRASILEELKKSNKGDIPYLKLEKNKLVSTQKARDLIALLPENLSSPILRANMEEQLKEIVKGNLSKEDYYNEVKKLINSFIEVITDGKPLPKQKTKVQASETKLQCPLCQDNIIETDVVFKCKNNKYINGKQSGCKFAIIRNQKLLKVKLAQKHLQRLLDNEILTAPNQNQIQLDLSNTYFTKIIFANNPSHNGIENKDELIETPKTYKLNDKFVFSNVFGKKLTKSEAKKILTGEEVLLKRKSAKTGKDYEVTVWLGEGGRCEHSF